MTYAEVVEAMKAAAIEGFEFTNRPVGLFGATKTRDLGISIETSGTESHPAYGKFMVSIESHQGMKRLGIFESIEETARFAQGVADETLMNEFGELREVAA